VTETPQYKHDCETCVFLGRFTDNSTYTGGVDREYDLYYHQGTIETTVVARFSDEGSDYSSGLFGFNPARVEAARRAIARGYDTEGFGA
jgi:hypothetical protein